MNLDYLYDIWMHAQKGIGLLLAVLLFGAVRFILLAAGVDPLLVKSLSVAMMLFSCAIVMLLMHPIEKMIFGDRVEFIQLSKTGKIIVTALLGIGIVLVIFETSGSVNFHMGNKAQEDEAKALREQLRDAQKTSTESLKKLNDMKNRPATTPFEK